MNYVHNITKMRYNFSYSSGILSCRQQEVEMRKRDVRREARHQIIPTLNLRIASISSQEQVTSGSCLTVMME